MPYQQTRILVVEEDRTLADLTAFRLELLGYGVEVVHSAEGALERLRDTLPDLIILDHFLPDMDGNELLNRLSNDEQTHPIPVMLFSTSADLDEVQRAYTAGAAAYLVIPFDPVVLEQKVETLLAAADRPS